MQVIAIANHKGGVGKTALAQNVSALLAVNGYRVLMIDLDPQSSLTSAWGIVAEGANMARVMGGSERGDMLLSEIVQTVRERLSIAPADIALASSELGLIGRVGRENVLKRQLEKVSGDYDVCLIDCPPSLSIMTVNALTAAHGVIIPTQPQVADLRGVQLFVDTILDLQEEINPKLEIIGLAPTFHDTRYGHHADAIEAMESGDTTVLPSIGRSVKVAECVGAGEPLHEYEPRNKQVEAFKTLTREIEKWLKSDQR